MSSLLNFIAHFHPLVVHLPIGMLLAALLLQVLAGRPAYAGLRFAVPVVLLAGFVSAVLSCVTGWLLAGSGDYDESLVYWHRWMGVSLTVLSLVLWVRVRRKGFDLMHMLLSLALLGMVIVTGHLGGSLTHGANYLGFVGARQEVDSPIVNMQEARAYQQVVRPILRDNCYSCHGATRQKGGLQMDDTAALLKGGKDGVVIRPGHGGASELIKRLLLPEEDEHHMPPKEKKQLNQRQIRLLQWWIDQGADLSRRVAELGQPDSVRPALLSVQGVKPRVMTEGDVPLEPVPAADEKAIGTLAVRGVRVMPMAQGSHWLEADGRGVVAGDWVKLLLPLHRQLISLRLDGVEIGDSAMAVIGQCDSLRRLDLAGTRIGDAGLLWLKGLHELRVLNLVGTEVSAAGLLPLRELPRLRAVYVYRTRVGHEDWAQLKQAFPKVGLDSGRYSMPKLVTDTAVVRVVVH